MIPLWLWTGGIALTVIAAIEIGYRVGRYRGRMSTHEVEAPVGTMVGATLGLLAFILAFTFGLAANQFEARREMVVDEANAIGTAFLRAGMLPEAQSAQVRSLLREYIAIRLEVLKTRNIEQTLERSDQLHRQLWQCAETAGNLHKESIPVGLFIESLNELIDVHAKRVQVALRNRLPILLWGALLFLTLFAMAGVGYHEGLFKSVRSPAILILVVSFSVIIALIADLDRPQEGVMQVSQEAMLQLQSFVQDMR